MNSKNAGHINCRCFLKIKQCQGMIGLPGYHPYTVKLFYFQRWQTHMATEEILIYAFSGFSIMCHVFEIIENLLNGMFGHFA